MLNTMARALAGVMGAYLGVCVVAGWWDPRLDGTAWLVDVRGWPGVVRAGVVVMWSVAWLGWAWRQPVRGGWRWRATGVVTAVAGVVVAADCVRFWRLVSAGVIDAGVALPLSLAVLAAVGVMAAGLVRGAGDDAAGRGTIRRWRWRAVSCGTVAAAAGVFTFGQMVAFGKTDYRRPAEAIVVFGARAYADGRCSDALADRVRTACGLWHAGYAPRLVMSGGPGDGAVHETEAMRRLAVSLGVPEAAITCDPTGVNTRATVRATAGDAAAGPVLAVSHFYHLARVKLAYQRAGVEVYTVPARERYTLTKLPLLMAREFAALWYYALTA